MPKANPSFSRRRKRTARSSIIRNLCNKSHTYLQCVKKQRKIPLRSSRVNEKDSDLPQMIESPVVEMDIPMESTASVSSELPDLEVQIDTDKRKNDELIVGRRVVNLSHVLNQYNNIVLHKYKCTGGNMRFVKEKRNGIFSILQFFCDQCEKYSMITSDPTNDEINEGLVWGCLSSGIGHHQCEEIFGLIDVPIMTSKTFAKKTALLKNSWQDHLEVKMREAGEEERRLALQAGHVTTDGVPYITVVGDGGWSKRSYGHGYNASSGVGVIIGAKTKMPLFLGVRNKVCSLCNFYKKKQQEPRMHECAMNFSGPSTAMEQDIIVEGFRCSIEQHGLIYKYYIGDGDSSVYARIVEKVSYGREVEKIECANHMIRGLNDKLHKIGSNTQYPLVLRKLLTSGDGGISRLERIVKGIRTAIKVASETGTDLTTLRHDIANALYHVFGRHTNCRNTFCKRNNEEDVFSKIENHEISVSMRRAVDPLIQKADRIILNQTTNYAERYMALVAKCVGGKRINYTGRLSYTARAQAAGLAHAGGASWHLSSWKYCKNKKPGTVMQRVFERRAAVKKNSRKPRKNSRAKGGPDIHYGPDAAKPDIDENQIAEATEKFIKTLQERVNSIQKINELQESTSGQHENRLWRDLRRNYLTASNFGAVIKRRKNTPCHNLVKRLLYSKDVNTAAIAYGRIHEEVAILKYNDLYHVQVQKCGMFVSQEYPFLAASSDGLINEYNGIVEVKCFPGIEGKTFRESVSSKTCFEIINNEIMLKKRHNYFFQIQGQLNIANKSFCDLILFSQNDFHVQRIYKDEILWKEEMVPKLKEFYFNSVLPEILDPRIPRGMKINERKIGERSTNNGNI